jgi:selenocysteine lyase/cysteine desulfurase
VVCAFREGAIRLSPHAYNTPDEMEKVVEALDGVVS